ncbi:MAG TPA: hypothetical protein PK971_01460 [Saprospiraceae bacterium]|nr:hypothetical protein [Saprospiraceae bacterium]HND86960.1 hypothetical protein [Saprospiraceae bacterium]
MNYFHAQGQPDQDIHHCTSHRDGDWIIWRCPYCQSYERRYNWVTNEMRVRTGGSEALHAGMNTQQQNMEALTMGLSPN